MSLIITISDHTSKIMPTLCACFVAGGLQLYIPPPLPPPYTIVNKQPLCASQS